MSAKNPVGDNEKATPVVADDWQETLKRIGGSQSDDWNHVLGDQALQSLWIKQSDKEVRQRQYNAAIAGLIGIGPKDEIESMIGAQLIATHNAAMECYRRAMMPEQTFEGRRENLSQATKLSRTCTILVEALNRHRGKGGQQKVTVEHVHVHAGGQAVVGMVETPGGGDGAKSEEQPHAKQIAHAPQPAMRSPDKEREPVPVGSDAERPLPDARRDVPGRPEG
jgi:hypothetical protein